MSTAPPPAGAPAQETTGFGHGKVILLGEHTVVYGHLAIAAGLPIGVHAHVRPGRGRVLGPDWQLDVIMGDGSDVGTALEKLAETLGADCRALDVTLKTEIPARAGLGSSAAMAVAIARAIAPWVGASGDPAAISAAVAAAETVFHGTPSGVDAAAASHGGVGVFVKGQGWTPATLRQPIKLCLGLSGRPRRTADLVEGLAVLARRTPSARKMIDALGDISRAGLDALALGDIDSLGRLFDLAHGVLAGLRLSTFELERLVYGARAAGALGAKLTGAGGGGAVIALAPSHRQDVIDRWQADGFAGLTATLGGEIMTAALRPRAVTARAGTNIALVKYWGKRDAALNLPAAGSLSLTLAELGSQTRVSFVTPATGGVDVVTLGDAPADAKFTARVSRFLDLVRDQAGITARAVVNTTNTVPTAAGLASSASGFAALALAATRAAGLDLPPPALSALARRGSGSAARSIFGGLVEMDAGQRADGADACARPLLAPADWDLRLVVALTAKGEKVMGSTHAMDHTAATSPYHAAWIESVEIDLAAARDAIAARDLARLGVVAERSALRMHASALAADPAILYWAPATVAVLHAVRAARAHSQLGAWATIDAGPHVKVLCRAGDAAQVAALLGAVPGVLGTLIASPGQGAAVVGVEP